MGRVDDCARLVEDIVGQVETNLTVAAHGAGDSHIIEAVCVDNGIRGDSRKGHTGIIAGDSDGLYLIHCVLMKNARLISPASVDALGEIGYTDILAGGNGAVFAVNSLVDINIRLAERLLLGGAGEYRYHVKSGRNDHALLILYRNDKIRNDTLEIIGIHKILKAGDIGGQSARERVIHNARNHVYQSLSEGEGIEGTR